MKKYCFTILAWCFMMTVNAQVTPESYLKRIPALPKDSCSVTLESNQMYTEKVQSLIDEIQSDIEARNEKANAAVEANKGAVEANAMSQVSQMTGMSQADLNKLKNSKNMTAAEKQALANQMLMQKTNMSMDEVKKLSTMSEAGKQAYMQAMGAEMMATSGNNQQTSPAVADMLIQRLLTEAAASGEPGVVLHPQTAAFHKLVSQPSLREALDVSPLRLVGLQPPRACGIWRDEAGQFPPLDVALLYGPLGFAIGGATPVAGASAPDEDEWQAFSVAKRELALVPAARSGAQGARVSVSEGCLGQWCWPALTPELFIRQRQVFTAAP